MDVEAVLGSDAGSSQIGPAGLVQLQNFEVHEHPTAIARVHLSRARGPGAARGASG